MDADHAGGSKIFERLPRRGIEDLESRSVAAPCGLAEKPLDTRTIDNVLQNYHEDRRRRTGHPGLVAMGEAVAEKRLGARRKMRGGIRGGDFFGNSPHPPAPHTLT